MFKSYLKIAWRSLKNQPFFTGLNTFGLAIGMAGAILITLYIVDELSFDKMFADSERIYRVDTDIKFGGIEMKSAESDAPMAPALQKDLPQVEMTVRFRTQGSALIRKKGSEENSKETNTTFVDPTFFKMFGLKLLAGDEKTALSEPNTVVLTKSAAEKHFGIQNAVGQTVLINNRQTYTITGVLDDLPKNSFLRNHSVFYAMTGYPDSHENLWGSNNYFTFFKLLPNTKIEDVQAPINGFLEKYMLPWTQKYFPGMTKESFANSGNYIDYHTKALRDIHLYSNKDHEMSANSSIQNVYILLFIGLFLIVLATINFMNLSTAYSLKRAKEVGIRKTLGSNKFELVRQFLTESGLISAISLLLALLIAIITLPFFNELSGKAISIPFTNPIFWGVALIATIILGLLAGSYPAFFMSRFMPVKTLKGGGQHSVGGSKVRNSLVVFQFAISAFLIICTLVVFQQLQFIQNKDLGFEKEQIVIIEDVYTAGTETDVFKKEVKKLGSVQTATLSSSIPTPSGRSNSTFFLEGTSDVENAIQAQTWDVDSDYLETFDIKLIAGRNFDPNKEVDSTAILINETLIKNIGLSATEVLGKRVTEDMDMDNEARKYYTVIGVIKDFHFEDFQKNVEPLSLFMKPSHGLLSVKLAAGNFANSLSSIESIWKNIVPSQPFNYRFMNDSFNEMYEAEQRLGKTFIAFTLLSIFIACLGLFGLAAFNAQKRTKEIGVRKVLGASISQIAYHLTVDFLKMVVIAVLVAVPVGWYVMTNWLQDFAYRIDIPWWTYVLTADSYYNRKLSKYKSSYRGSGKELTNGVIYCS